jgi:hypothetical protein
MQLGSGWSTRPLDTISSMTSSHQGPLSALGPFWRKMLSRNTSKEKDHFTLTKLELETTEQQVEEDQRRSKVEMWLKRMPTWIKEERQEIWVSLKAAFIKNSCGPSSPSSQTPRS